MGSSLDHEGLDKYYEFVAECVDFDFVDALKCVQFVSNLSADELRRIAEFLLCNSADETPAALAVRLAAAVLKAAEKAIDDHFFEMNLNWSYPYEGYDDEEEEEEEEEERGWY